MATVNIQELSAYKGGFTLTDTALIGLGSFPDEAIYKWKIKARGISFKDGRTDLNITLDTGNGDIYMYVVLPTDPTAEKHTSYVRAFNRVVAATTSADGKKVPLDKLAKMTIDAAMLDRLFAVGATVDLYYIPPDSDSGQAQETICLTEEEIVKIRDGQLKPPQRRKKKQEPAAGVSALGIVNAVVSGGVSVSAPTGALSAAAATPPAAQVDDLFS